MICEINGKIFFSLWDWNERSQRHGLGGQATQYALMKDSKTEQNLDNFWICNWNLC